MTLLKGVQPNNTLGQSSPRFTVFSKLGLALGLLCLLTTVACRTATEETTTTAAAAETSVLYPVPDDPTVSFIVWFQVGSQNDPEGKEGLASLTGSLISQGATQENSYDTILKKLYPLASSYSVRVDKEMTTVSGRTHRDNLEAFFGLFTDAYIKPAFSEEDFQRLQSDQLNFLESTLRYSSDEELGKAALTEFIFDGTGYSHPIFGSASGLKNLSVEDVKSFYQTYYTRDNAVVALGGGYSDDLRERFEESLNLLPKGQPEEAAKPQPTTIQGRHVLLVSKENADASISFGFPIDVHRGERDFYALWLANSWLGEHRNSASHLYQVIREERGLNYGDYSYIEAFPQGGFRQMPPTNVARRQQIFEIWIRTLPNDQAHFALRAAMRELETLIEEGMSEEDFELTRGFLLKYSLHYAESTYQRLGYAVDDRFYGIDGEGHLARLREVIGSLTRQEVNDALKKHFQPENLKIAIITGAAEDLAQALAEEKPSPITYENPKNEEILAQDKEISVYPLNIPSDNIHIVPVEEMFEG